MGVRCTGWPLRQKLEEDPAQPQYFITELQVGYRLMGL